MTTADVALARFEQKYSCSQVVLSALAERFGVAPELAFRIAAGFGGGIARSARTCGCVTGAAMAIGLSQSGVSPDENRVQKEKIYEKVQRFLREFEARNGSTQCLALLGYDIGTPEGMAQIKGRKLFETRCRALVRDAVEIAEAILE